MVGNKWVLVGLVAALFIVGIGFAFAGSPTGWFAASAAPEKVKIGYYAIVMQLPAFVAEDRGYFAKRGLSPEFVRFDSPNQFMDALTSGQIDIGSTGGPMGIASIIESKQPGAVKVYSLAAGDLDHLSDELLVPINSSIKSISDLPGKKVGHFPGIQWKTLTRYVLQKNGIDLSTVQLVELAPQLQLQALAQGSVDALFTLEPTGIIGSKKGVSRVLVPAVMAQNIADPWFGGAGLVSTRFLNDRPTVAKKAIEAIKEGIVTTRQEPETKKLLTKFTALNEQTAMQVPLGLFKTVEELSDKDIEATQQFIDIFWQSGVTKSKVDVRRMLLR